MNVWCYNNFYVSSVFCFQISNCSLDNLHFIERFNTRRDLHWTIEEIWFDQYPRALDSNISDSSGFEHVFVGEIEGTAVRGMQNWVQFYMLEQAGTINYHGYFKSDEVSQKLMPTSQTFIKTFQLASSLHLITKGLGAIELVGWLVRVPRFL